MSSELRTILGGIDVEDRNSGLCPDNLAIALCSYFSDHMDRPDDDEETERGWGAWVEQKTNEALDLITAAVEAHVSKNARPAPQPVDDVCCVWTRDWQSRCERYFRGCDEAVAPISSPGGLCCSGCGKPVREA